MRSELDCPHDRLGHYEGPFPSGAPAIVASTAGRLAAAHDLAVGFVGTVGDDAFGAVLRAKLQADSVNTDYLASSSSHATGVAFVQLNRNGSRSFVFSAGAATELGPAQLSPHYFTKVRALHLSGSSLALDARLRQACLDALSLALEQNPDCLVTFDPNFRLEMARPEQAREQARSVLARATHLLPSGDELKFLTAEDSLEAACAAAFAQGPRLSCIILKQGAAGARSFLRDDFAKGGTKIDAPIAVERYPTGAGDNFSGALLVALLTGHSVAEATRYACAAGALAVEQAGLMKTFTWADLERELRPAG